MRYGWLALSLAALLVAGCRPGEAPPEPTPRPAEPPAEAPAQEPPAKTPGQAQKAPPTPTPGAQEQQTVLYISGPGGTVQLGDTLQQAQRAFPAPQGATVHQTTFSLHLVSRKGWAWESGMEQSFEVALDEDNLVAGLAFTEQGDTDQLLRRVTRLHGAPHHQAEGTAASMYSWLRGPDALVVLHIDAPGLPKSRLQVLGNSNKLQLMGYPVANPQEFVRQADAMSQEASQL